MVENINNNWDFPLVFSDSSGGPAGRSLPALDSLCSSKSISSRQMKSGGSQQVQVLWVLLTLNITSHPRRTGTSADSKVRASLMSALRCFLPAFPAACVRMSEAVRR